MAHFTAALGRGQPWWAAGLDALRGYCVNLARLRADFNGHVDGFDKLDSAVPAADPCSAGLDVRPARLRSDAGRRADHGRLLPGGRSRPGGRAPHPVSHRAGGRAARAPGRAGALSVPDDSLFLQLDYLYMPSRDVPADLRFLCRGAGRTHGLRHRWHGRAGGNGGAGRTAATRPAGRSPGGRRAGAGLPGRGPGRRDCDLRQRGWKGGTRLEIPQGPICSFVDPGGHRLAIYQLTRPQVIESFAGRHDQVFGARRVGGRSYDPVRRGPEEAPPNVGRQPLHRARAGTLE